MGKTLGENSVLEKFYFYGRYIDYTDIDASLCATNFQRAISILPSNCAGAKMNAHELFAVFRKLCEAISIKQME